MWAKGTCFCFRKNYTTKTGMKNIYNRSTSLVYNSNIFAVLFLSQIHNGKSSGLKCVSVVFLMCIV